VSDHAGLVVKKFENLRRACRISGRSNDLSLTLQFALTMGAADAARMTGARNAGLLAGIHEVQSLLPETET
jgi:hypothetical protein